MAHRQAAIAHYHQHIEDVKAACAAERLLIYSVDQGWGPLCAFSTYQTPKQPSPMSTIGPKLRPRLVGSTWRLWASLEQGRVGLAGLGWLALGVRNGGVECCFWRNGGV
jgi:hypothetical protein